MSVSSSAARDSPTGLDQLEHHGANTIDVLQSVDGRDAGMVQRSENLCFPLEAGKAIRLGGEVLRSTLSATSLPSFRSFARNTSPMPPVPSSETSSYQPIRVPEEGMNP